MSPSMSLYVQAAMDHINQLVWHLTNKNQYLFLYGHLSSLWMNLIVFLLCFWMRCFVLSHSSICENLMAHLLKEIVVYKFVREPLIKNIMGRNLFVQVCIIYLLYLVCMRPVLFYLDIYIYTPWLFWVSTAGSFSIDCS